MSLPRIDSLTSLPALDHPGLLADPVGAALVRWPGSERTAVVEIDPDLADTAAMSEAYEVPLAAGANCLVVAGRRNGEERVAACVVRADTRVDVNSAVKRILDVRKASFLPTQQAVDATGMEHGGITPLGLPSSWRLLVDSRVPEMDTAILGSGLRRSKLLVPGALVADMPGAEVVDRLAA